MITALLVDDSEFMRALLRSIITQHQFEVIGEANNGVIAVEKYKELNPDTVFMDIMMDEMDGVEALKQILNHDPDAMVVMVSSMMTQTPFVNDAVSLGAKAIINKPFVGKEVEAVLVKLKSMMADAALLRQRGKSI